MPRWKRMLLAALAELLAPKKRQEPTVREYERALELTLNEAGHWPVKHKEYLQ